MFTIIMHLKKYRLPCPLKRKQAFISLSNFRFRVCQKSRTLHISLLNVNQSLKNPNL